MSVKSVRTKQYRFIDLLGQLDGSVVSHRNLESVLSGVAAAGDAAVGDARHSGGEARHEVQLGEVHSGRQLADHVHSTLALKYKRRKKKVTSGYTMGHFHFVIV